MSKVMRGRPRKIVAQSAPSSPVGIEAEEDFVTVVTSPSPMQEGIKTAPDRMSEVLELVQPVIDHAGTVQAHNNCVTISYGNYSECINITAPDTQIRRMVDRILKIGV